MKKQIKEFPQVVDLTPHNDYYVLQRVFDSVLATTYKISITDLAKTIFNNFFNLRVKAPLIIETEFKSLVGATHRAPTDTNVILSLANWHPADFEHDINTGLDVISDKTTSSNVTFLHGPVKDDDTFVLGFYTKLVSYGEDYPIMNRNDSSKRPNVFSIKLQNEFKSNSTDFGLDYTVFTKPVVLGQLTTDLGFGHRIPSANVSLSIADWINPKAVIDLISKKIGSSEINFLHGTLVDANNQGTVSYGTNWTTLLAVADDAPEVDRNIWPYNLNSVTYKPSTFSLLHFSQKGHNIIDVTPYFSMFSKPMIIESAAKSPLYNHSVVGYSHFYNSSQYVSHNFNVMLSIANWTPNACNTVDVLSNRNAFSRINLAHGPVGSTTNALDVPFQTLLTSYGPDGTINPSDCVVPDVLNNSPNDTTLDGNISDTTAAVINHLQSNNINPSVISAASTNVVPNANNLPALNIGKKNTFTLAVISTSTQVNVTETTTSYSMFNKPIIVDGFVKSYAYAHRVLGAPKSFDYAFTQSGATKLSVANWSEYGCAVDIQAMRTTTAKINLLHGVTASSSVPEKTTFYTQLVSQGSSAPAYTSADASPLLIDQRCVMDYRIIKEAGRVFSIITREQLVRNSTDFRLEFTTFNGAVNIESAYKETTKALRTYGYSRYFSTTNLEGSKNVMLSVANYEPVSSCDIDVISKKYSSGRINFIHELTSELKSDFFTSLVSNGSGCVPVTVAANANAPYVINATLETIAPTLADAIINGSPSDDTLDAFTVIMANKVNFSTLNAEPTAVTPVRVGNKNTFRIITGDSWPEPSTYNITKYTVDCSIHHKPMIIDGPLQSATRTAAYTHRVLGAPKYFSAPMIASPSVMLSVANWIKSSTGCAVDVISNRDAVSRVNFLHGPYATASNSENVGFYSSIISYGQNFDTTSVTSELGKVDQLTTNSAAILKTPAETLSLFVRKDTNYNYSEFRPLFSMFNRPMIVESFIKSTEYGHKTVGYSNYYTTGNSYAGNPSTMLSVANWNKLNHCYVDIISAENSKSQINLLHAPIMTSSGPDLRFLSTITSFGPGTSTVPVEPDANPCATALDSHNVAIASTEQPYESGVITDDDALDAAYLVVPRLDEYATTLSSSGVQTLNMGDNKCLKFEVTSFYSKSVIEQSNLTKMSLDWTLYNKPVIIESEIKSGVYTHRTVKPPKYFTQRFVGSPEVMLSIANWNHEFDCSLDIISTRNRTSVINFLHGPTVLQDGSSNYGFRVSLQSVGQNYLTSNVCDNITQPKRFIIRLEDDAGCFNPTIFTLSYVSMNKIVLRNLIGTSSPLYSDINGCVIQLCSDFKLKKDIAPIEPGLKEVLELTPVEFKWKPNADFSFDPDKLDYGLIAQDVQKLIPTIIGKTATDYLTVDYLKLIPVLIKAIQELSAIVGVKHE